MGSTVHVDHRFIKRSTHQMQRWHFTSWLCGQLVFLHPVPPMTSHIYTVTMSWLVHEISMDQIFIVKRFIVDLVCSSKCQLISLLKWRLMGKMLSSYNERPLKKKKRNAALSHCIQFCDTFMMSANHVSDQTCLSHSKRFKNTTRLQVKMPLCN